MIVLSAWRREVEPANALVSSSKFVGCISIGRSPDADSAPRRPLGSSYFRVIYSVRSAVIGFALVGRRASRKQASGAGRRAEI